MSAGANANVLSSVDTRALLQCCLSEATDQVLAVNIAAKFLALSDLGVSVTARMQDINAVWASVSEQLGQHEASELLAASLARITGHDDTATKRLASAGIQLNFGVDPGNTDSRIDQQTDKVMNGGDFETPSFNG